MLWIGRRELIAGALTLFAGRSQGQSTNRPVVGALLNVAAVETSYTWKRLVDDLRILGYVEGRNVRYATRAIEDPAGLSVPAGELVKLSPKVIYANGDEAARAVAAASTSIPIVAMTDDHIGAGLTENLAHPSRNVTGISRLEADLDTKRLELLHEMVPAANLILVLRDPGTSFESRSSKLEQAASQSGLKLLIRDIRGANDIEAALAEGKAAGAGAVLVLGSPFLTTPKIDGQIKDMATRHHLPTMVQLPSSARRGNLASYGLDQDAAIERLAYMIRQVLKGTDVKEIPIEQPTKFEFVINVKTAKALGLSIRPSVLARADDLVE